MTTKTISNVGVWMICVVVVLCAGCQTVPTAEMRAAGATIESGHLQSWIICGEFPNPAVAGGDATDPATRRTGLDIDYLQEHGGESKIRPKAGLVHTRPDGTQATWVTHESNSRIIDLTSLFAERPSLSNVVAYAYTTVSAETAGEAYLDLNSDDGISAWLNGKLVHKNQVSRNVWTEPDRVTVNLRRGENRLLLKIEQFGASWCFSAGLMSYQLVDELEAQERVENDLRAFQDCELRPEGNYDYMITPKKFPKIVWDNPDTVERVIGTCELTIRWFNNALEEVEKPTGPGRYLAYVEGTSDKGFTIRRALTVYCRPENWRPWWNRPQVTVAYPEDSPIDETVWQEHQELIGEHASQQFIEHLQTDEAGAILMAYLHETEPRGRKPTQIESPKILNNDIHLALKLKILAEAGMGQGAGLQPPVRRKTPATALRKGTSAEAGMRPDTADKIREVCQAWVEDSGRPFVTLVARNGVIFVHDAFNADDSDLQIDSQLSMASLTKTMCGLMFAQFIDQGLIDLDDPIGKYLPDYPLEGEDAVTFRHCFTHTLGMKDHYRWGGVHNPWMDNVMLTSLGYLTPGEKKRYGGMGYNLVGKAMEVVGRKSIIRMIHENFFEPLGIQHTEIDDMACATTSTAMDMAIMGQLLLNQGSYDDIRLFGPETFAKMLPQELSKYYPGIDLEIGTGLIWLQESDPQAGTDGVPSDKTLLSRNTIGHRAASGAVLRVDLDNGVVLVQIRNTGKDEGEHFIKLLQTIDNGIIDRKP